MNSSRLLVLLLLTPLALLSACSRPAPCDDCDCAPSTTTSNSLPTTSASPVTTDAEKPTTPPRKFPLKGVITEILPERSALMVKHEAIPGVMKAMTMLFIVDTSVLSTVKKGDAITALMSRRSDDWRLDDVKIIPPTP